MIIEALGDLRDMDVREVMTPRLDIVALTIPVSAEDVARAVRESGHSCYPVVSDALDDVVGVLYVNDLFRSRRSTRAELLGTGTAVQDEGLPSPPHDTAGAAGTGTGAGTGAATGARAGRPVRRASGAGIEARAAAPLSTVEISRRIRQAYVVPESRPILAALVEMRRHHRSFAVVVDEHGGVSGVLTVKDLLEPIVGELHDELDEEEAPSIVRVDGGRWLVDGLTNVDEVRERLHIDVPEGEYVTIGGYLLDVLGHIPTEGESTSLEGWELTVHDMDKRRIAAVIARRLEPAQDGAEPAGPEGYPTPAASARSTDEPVAGATDAPSGPATSGAPAADDTHAGGGAPGLE